MEILLDCSNEEAAWTSVCRIFNTNKLALVEVLRSIQPYQPNINRPEDYIYEVTCSALGRPSLNIMAMWFHGTRTADIAAFHQKGILPKSKVRGEIELILAPLVSGIQKSGVNQFSMSIQGKQTPADEGPFAVLFREVAVHAPGAHHSYIDVPEMVEDIAGTWFGENYGQLVARYQSIAKPYVVVFKGEAGEHELSLALWYLHSIVDGDPAIEAADRANTCFNSNGVAIAPARIVRTELVEEDC